MRVRPEQLLTALQKTLAPVYFISGDEPLQMQEAADVIRKTAQRQGFSNREILTVDSHFEWRQLALTAAEQSIFSDKKIIDLRLTGSTPGTEGAKALVQYCQHLPDDTVLLLTGGKLASASLKSQWFLALDNVGVVAQVWSLEGSALLAWLQQRAQQRGLRLDRDGIKAVATRIEGNLLAAAQEIEKLYVLYGSDAIGVQQVADSMADSSRYDVFALVAAALEANVNRLLKILESLKAEAIAAPVVLWALTREVRTLIKIKWQLSEEQPRDTVFKNHQIWDKRQALISNALNRLNVPALNAILILAAKADRQIKGQQTGDAWETLRMLCLRLAGVDIG